MKASQRVSEGITARPAQDADVRERQVFPFQLSTQSQRKSLSRSTHSPPFSHGLRLHSFTSGRSTGVSRGQQGHALPPIAAYGRGRSPALHSGPSHPAGQKHWKTLMPSMQVPPFRHGEEAQSLMSARGRRER